MPLFDIICAECGAGGEILARNNNELICPNCGSKKVTRIYSAPALPLFKGPGFYETDYKHKEPSNGSV
ncbi:FmdB family zinc ribbon protein [Acinetobacter sp.]|uniref:FmdB family zinc ribbon protein n=1 Tax=Acinetobacter sp. TaxID=472 RepID=UPI003D00607F